MEMTAMAQGETRYQRIQRLLREGQCGLLPLDLTCACAKRGGPDHAHPDYPGKVGFLTCQGCQHHAGLYFENQVCTQPHARRVAARWLAEAIRAWEAAHTRATAAPPRGCSRGIQPQVAGTPSSPDAPQRQAPAQLAMF
jgi:hypothetical protein